MIEQDCDPFYHHSRGLRGSCVNASTEAEVVGGRRSFLVLAEGRVPGADRVLNWLVRSLRLETCHFCH